MKKLILTLSFIALAMTSFSQAVIGNTEYEIRQMYPEKVVKEGYTTEKNERYISIEFNLGLMAYYFDESGKSYECMFIPNNATDANAMVESLNKRYAVTSTRSWKAYLDNGQIMSITMFYDSDMKSYLFAYKAAE